MVFPISDRVLELFIGSLKASVARDKFGKLDLQIRNWSSTESRRLLLHKG